MIEQTVNSILEAEDEAKRRIAAAETDAAEIINDGEIAVEAARKAASAQNKTYFAEQIAAIDAQAAAQAADFLARANAESDRQTDACRANLDKALKIVLEQL